MNFSILRLGVAVSLGFASMALAVAGEPSGDGVTISADPATGKLDVDQPVTWIIQQTKPTTQPLHYRLTENNFKTIEAGDLDPSQPKTIAAKLDHAGWLYLVVENDDSPANRLIQSAGAVVDLASIRTGRPIPDDFWNFWDDQLQQIRKQPANAKITTDSSDVPDVHYEEILLDNVEGAHVHTQLARPDRQGKFPAMIVFQAAGVGALPKTIVTNHAKQGWLALDVMAHDLPLHESKDFYTRLQIGGRPAAEYTRLGADHRETSYFRKMFLGDYQAIAYLRTRDDWDGKTLLVRGESQGGMQSIALCGLDPQHVTACIVTVPAGADINGNAAGRTPGFPYWFRLGGDDAKLQAAVDATGPYFDAANFATHVTCPTLVCGGVRDTTSPIPGVAALYNHLAGPKALVVMPSGTHRHDHDDGTARVKAWEESLLKTGQPALTGQ